MTGRAQAKTRASGVNSVEDLTVTLAERVMRWSAAPERFLIGGRSWIPRWRFRPYTNLEDAFRLLEKAASTFTLALKDDGTFSVQVQANERAGSAVGISKAATITVAVARAIGLEVPDGLTGSRR